MTKFVFGVLLYNQEKFVIQTLESIKYQIQKFGQQIKCKIVIVDDCSTDNSVLNVKKWLEKNEYLFDKAVVKVNEKNKGTVFNYNYILKQVKDEECFKIIAADDIFASGNLFKKYENISDDKLDTYLRVCIINDDIMFEKQSALNFYYERKRYNRRKLLKRFKIGGYLHTPSTIYSIQLYKKSECEVFNSNFRLFEDDPTWYMMIKNNKNLNVEFKSDIIVLYRIHSSSVSNKKCKGKSEFDKELEKLHKYYFCDSTGFERLYWWFRNSRNIPKAFDFSNYVDAINKIGKKIISYSSDYRKWKVNIDVALDIEREYYASIMSESEKFINQNCMYR